MQQCRNVFSMVMVGLVGVCLAAGCKSETPTPVVETPVPAPKLAEEKAPAPAGAHDALDINDPASCEPCHGVVVKEWRESMHSRADQSKDPVFAGMRKLRMAKQGDEVAQKCVQCHNPRATQAPDSPAGLAGVSCAACHNAMSIKKGALGAKALVFAEDQTMFGPHDLAPDASPVHAMGPSPAWMKGGNDLCLACHGEMRNAQGAPTCTTGPELSRAAKPASCASCHMPRVQGPAGQVGQRQDHASHAFLGPHRAWYQNDASFLASGVKMMARWKDGALLLTLRNLSGHAFPSGFPGRVALLKISGEDHAGAVVWNAWEKDAMAEAPALVLNKVYVDKEGKPTLPPFAASLKRDARLKPDEVREVRVEVPKAVAAVEIKMLYALVPGKVAPKLGLTGKPEAKPVVLHTLRVVRDAR